MMKEPSDTTKMTEKLLNDKLISTKLSDNFSFQYVLAREIQQQIKSETQDSNQT